MNNTIDDIIGQAQGTLNCISLFSIDNKESLQQLEQQILSSHKDLVKIIAENQNNPDIYKARVHLNKVIKVEELLKRAIEGDEIALAEAEGVAQEGATSISNFSEAFNSGNNSNCMKGNLESPKKSLIKKQNIGANSIKEFKFNPSIDDISKKVFT